MEKELMTHSEVMEYLNVSRTTLYRMRANGLKDYPKGKKIYFLKEDVIKWITKK